MADLAKVATSLILVIPTGMTGKMRWNAREFLWSNWLVLNGAIPNG